jgi:hypothetical protein
MRIASCAIVRTTEHISHAPAVRQAHPRHPQTQSTTPQPKTVRGEDRPTFGIDFSTTC